MCQKQMANQTLIRNAVYKHVTQAFTTTLDVYNASLAFYKGQPERAEDIRQVGSRCEIAEHHRAERQDLRFDQVLGYMRKIEEAKMNHAAHASISLSLKKISKE